ncbi:hypothetical protein WA577_004465 [Blastocystis sp. JDR]
MSALVARIASPLSRSLFFRSMTNVKSCIDRSEVSERVMNVVKGFDFVDASKVTPVSHFASDLGLDAIETKTVVDAIKADFCLEDCPCCATSIDEITANISRNPRAK